MNRILGLSVLATLLLVAAVPAPASASSVICIATIDYCVGDCTPVDGCCNVGNVDLCSVTVEPVVRDNGDGTMTVGVIVCTPFRCNSVVRTVPTDPCASIECDPCSSINCDPDVCATVPAACSVDDLCFTYNPSALTNMCVTTGSDPETISHPTATLTSRTTCVIGNEVCATHAWVATGQGSTTVNVPTADGYVEATVLCVGAVPCRVTLP